MTMFRFRELLRRRSVQPKAVDMICDQFSAVIKTINGTINTLRKADHLEDIMVNNALTYFHHTKMKEDIVGRHSLSDWQKLPIQWMCEDLFQYLKVTLNSLYYSQYVKD